MRAPDTLQQAFANAIIDTEPTAASLSIFAGDTAQARDRIGYYRGNQHETALKVLRAAYPVVLALMGDAFFEGLSHAYGQTHPSRDPDLHRYGESFPAFLATFGPVAPYPYLPDVARLEWLCHMAYYAADDVMLDAAMLQSMAPADVAALAVTLCRCAQPFSAAWAAVPIWQAHQSGGPPLPECPDTPSHGMVIRPRWRVSVIAMPPAQVDVLDRLREQPTTLGDLLWQAASADPSFDAASTLAAWLETGLLCLASPHPTEGDTRS
ncbi:putative DNA-binding domain-containing protein [Cupriavidus pinatubonensis]|uniref:HvfC/BufC family peptide modification chaperone n=1 Tax=Cupriavidus pinatubonensis TaxID=248026 RepID=UPI001FD60CDE|nr:putative DNA-binding domain-containing protein [Cupriavidus pinatubonensis]